MAWYPEFGWLDLDDEMAQALELNMNYKWQLWRVEWLGAGMGFKVRTNGRRFVPQPEPEAVKPKAKPKKKAKAND